MNTKIAVLDICIKDRSNLKVGLIYEEVSEFTLLFTGSRNIFFVTGCSNLSSLIAFLGLGLIY